MPSHKTRKRRQRSIKRILRGGQLLTDIVEPVRTLIHDVFPHLYSDVVYYPSTSKNQASIAISVYCADEDYKNEDTVPSITMTIKPISKNTPSNNGLSYELYVNTIAKCNPHNGINGISGTDVIKSVILIGKKLIPFRVTQIRLKDASQMYFNKIEKGKKQCKISLALYKILTSNKHHSWYNSYGFVSSNYANEVEHNTKIAQMPMTYLLSALGASRSPKWKSNILMNILTYDNKVSNSWKKYVSDKATDESIAEFDETYVDWGISHHMSIQDAISAIHERVKDQPVCHKNDGANPQIRFYIELMDVARYHLILYNTNLIYSLL